MKITDFHSAFNARHLNPAEVAETFIWSESYGKLIQDNHTVILGARGCGKTTLMKMLTLPALHAWADPRASKIKNEIPFYAIYISTDIYWDVKNQTYSSQLKKYGTFSEAISMFSVTTNVFTSLCDTFQDIIDYEIKNYTEDKEIEISRILTEAWKLPKIIPQIKHIKEALHERIDKVNQSIQRLILDPNTTEVPYFDFFDLSFDTSVQLAVIAFERIFEIKNKRNWAFCFDELEFAPAWLTSKLFTSLRSTNQRFIYKLSSSPILPAGLQKTLSKLYGATSGNDFTTIKMWANSDNEQFSKKIITSLLERAIPNTSSQDYFGTNPVYSAEPDTYTNNSPFHKELKELFKKDDAFKRFLNDKKVNVENPSLEDPKLKNTLFRKLKPVVYFRNFYIYENRLGIPSQPVLRSRKSSDLYYGIEVLSKICDGNPRWLIGIVSAILVKSESTKPSRSEQSEEIIITALRFKNVLANLPVGKNSSILPTKILDRLGHFFTKQILGPSFHMDPKGTIEIREDEVHNQKNIIDFITKGISQGAFILSDSDNDSFDYDIVGKRIKLSYLFYPLYKLPLRSYNPAKLSECIREEEHMDSDQITLIF